MRRLWLPGVVTVMLATACGDDQPVGAGDPAVVFAPSSLAVVQDEFDEAFEARDQPPPEWFFAGSQRLLSQLLDGAPADVLITADERTYSLAREAGVLADPGVPLAHNHLVTAVAPGNPAGIEALDDLAEAGPLVGVCAPEVPCGRLATEALRALGIELAADTEEPSARALTQKIVSGELDAGLIYRTDALASGLELAADTRLEPFRTTYLAGMISDPVALEIITAAAPRILATAGFEVP